MSSTQLLPYVRTCGFCENGLLRLWVSETDDRSVALCDECELYWEDMEAVYKDKHAPSSGAYPVLVGKWRAGTMDDVDDRDLGTVIRGASE
ncbi:MAG: hypothetical protein ACI8T1_003005 [Verrucomicrobiales bacterium]|jgi:hypothetical protein